VNSLLTWGGPPRRETVSLLQLEGFLRLREHVLPGKQQQYEAVGMALGWWKYGMCGASGTLVERLVEHVKKLFRGKGRLKGAVPVAFAIVAGGVARGCSDRHGCEAVARAAIEGAGGKIADTEEQDGQGLGAALGVPVGTGGNRTVTCAGDLKNVRDILRQRWADVYQEYGDGAVKCKGPARGVVNALGARWRTALFELACASRHGHDAGGDSAGGAAGVPPDGEHGGELAAHRLVCYAIWCWPAAKYTEYLGSLD